MLTVLVALGAAALAGRAQGEPPTRAEQAQRCEAAILERHGGLEVRGLTLTASGADPTRFRYHATSRTPAGATVEIRGDCDAWKDGARVW